MGIEVVIAAVVGVLVGYAFRAYIAATEAGKKIDEFVDKNMK